MGERRLELTRRYFISRLASTPIVLLGSGQLEAADRVDARFGVNLSVIDIDASKIPLCALRNDHAVTFAGHAFLPRYRSASVRDSVKKTLDSLGRRGAGSIRCLLWFDKVRSSTGDSCDTNDGGLVGGNLASFSEDMMEAGLERLMVAFGPQGAHSPSCRRTTWGDCFSENTLEQTALFMQDVRNALGDAKGLDIWFDLMNEGVPANNLPEAARRQFLDYMQYIVPYFRQKFPKDRISVSLQGGLINERIRYLLENFDPQGAGPDFYSIHLYKSAGDVLLALNELLTAIGSRPKPVFVGEIENDQKYYMSVDAFLRRTLAKDYLGIFVWPLRNPKNQCAIDTEPKEIGFR